MANNNRNKSKKTFNPVEEVEEVKENAIDLLMKVDNSQFGRASKFIKMERLSEMIGQDFIVEIKELLPTFSQSLYESCVDINVDGNIKAGLIKMQNLTIIEAVLYEGASLFKNQKLMKKFGVKIPTDLLYKLTTRKERDTLFEMIENLGDNEGNMFTEVKN